MKYYYKIVILLSAFLLQSRVSLAQVYPVQGNAALIPPYSVYISDYTSRTTDRLVLNLALNDITRPELRVRLRIRLESQNVRIETRPEYIGSAITLQGGIPQRLNGTDLIEYFNPNNLSFSGISRREFEQTGALPEGLYQFCFEVLEYNRGVKISNTICATAWLILNDPPLINLPQDNAKLTPTIPQNLVFQWTPRHTGSPNAAFNAEYEIKMVELWPANRNPNDAILTSPPILETTTRNTSFVYGPSETPLEPGRRYALRVKAKSLVGGEEYDLFKNNGYSAVVSFVYGDACEVPGAITADSPGGTRFNVKWQGLPNHTAFKLRYRETGTTQWYENTGVVNEMEITSLKPGTTYEYQVAGSCGLFDGQYSSMAQIKTKDAPAIAYSCGVPLDNLNLDPAQLAPTLQVGQVIHAGDFDVKLSKAEGSNGLFSGEGVVEVPYFNKAKAKVEFTNITVNKDLRVVGGVLNVTGAGVDVIPSGVTNFMDQLSETLDQIDTALTIAENNLPQDFDPNSFIADKLISIPGGVTAPPYIDDDGTIVVVDRQGNETRLPPGQNYAIRDDEGHGYLIDKKGTIHATTADVATQAANRELHLALNFAAAENAQYGFDDGKLNQSLPNEYEILNDTYVVAWKAIKANATDVVTAVLSDPNIDKTKVHFEIGGDKIDSSPFGTAETTSVTIPGQSNGTVQDLMAIYTPSDTGKHQVLGKLKVVSYNEIPRTVVIVPVNGAKLLGSIDELKTELNEIYQQAVVTWQVEEKPGIEVTLGDAFDDGESGLLTNYTGDMKQVINAYKAQMADDKFYLFLINNPKSGRGALGYMPRGRRAGFIFTSSHDDATQFYTTVAHELGHGAFNLYHTFDEERFKLAKGSTDNLMDYPAGRKLHKYQWSKMRFADIVIGLFEEDETSELAMLPCWGWFDECDDVLTMLKGIKSRVANKNAILPLFKPDAQKKRGKLYIANSLEIDGEIYSRIEIRNEIKIDDYVDPKVYSDFEDGKTNDKKLGFIYTPSENSYFKVIVSNEGDSLMVAKKREKLREYLFGDLKPKKEKEAKDTEYIFLDQVQYVSQFDETIFGLCSGCWAQKQCCRRATEYMMGNTNMANCTDTIIAKKAPYMTISEIIVTASFSNNTIKYTKETYNAETLNYDANKTKEALTYMMNRLRDNLPVLIGVHYTNGGTPPNNNNRATRHFMVVIGMTRDGNDVSFRFYDPGRSLANQESATSTSNLLKYNVEKGWIQGSYNDKIYTLSEVAKPQ